MTYLQRIKARPNLDDFIPGDARWIQTHFDPYAGEVIVDGEVVAWGEIEEIEVAKAPRAVGLAGWLVRHVVHGDERYHVGIYYGRQEAVLPNVTLAVAQYVVQCVAYFAPLPVRYRGPDGLSPVIEE